MTYVIWAAATYCGIATLLHLATIAIAIVRCQPPTRRLEPPADAPPVTLVQPVCGIDNHIEMTLRSSFELDYPRFEIIFCFASGKDAAVPVVRSLMAQHVRVNARLLVGDERISGNPKLNNCYKGWLAATHDWIVLADSNILMPRDYLQRLFAAWGPDTGVVSAPPVGGRPVGFPAALECAFLNTFQARWQYFADTIGLGFAHGKTVFWRRADLNSAGGLRALATETAEDAASTKVIRAAGQRVRLVDAAIEQPLGERSLSDVWNRQVRWARLRRASFVHFYALELTAGAVLPLAAGTFVALAIGGPAIAYVSALAALWYGGEAVLAAFAGWHLPRMFPVHALLRDLMLPVLWIEGWRERSFVWRGNLVSVDQTSKQGNMNF